MTETGIGSSKVNQNASHINWRHFWLTNVMIDTGKPGATKIARHDIPFRKNTLSRRLHKLHHMKATLGPLRSR